MFLLKDILQWSPALNIFFLCGIRQTVVNEVLLTCQIGTLKLMRIHFPDFSRLPAYEQLTTHRSNSPTHDSPITFTHLKLVLNLRLRLLEFKQQNYGGKTYLNSFNFRAPFIFAHLTRAKIKGARKGDIFAHLTARKLKGARNCESTFLYLYCILITNISTTRKWIFLQKERVIPIT